MKSILQRQPLRSKSKITHMHRRHFIKLSGLSLAGLLVPDLLEARQKNYTIQMPDSVEILIRRSIFNITFPGPVYVDL